MKMPLLLHISFNGSFKKYCGTQLIRDSLAGTTNTYAALRYKTTGFPLPYRDIRS